SLCSVPGEKSSRTGFCRRQHRREYPQTSAQRRRMDADINHRTRTVGRNRALLRSNGAVTGTNQEDTDPAALKLMLNTSRQRQCHVLFVQRLCQLGATFVSPMSRVQCNYVNASAAP